MDAALRRADQLEALHGKVGADAASAQGALDAALQEMEKKAVEAAMALEEARAQHRAAIHLHHTALANHQYEISSMGDELQWILGRQAALAVSRPSPLEINSVLRTAFEAIQARARPRPVTLNPTLANPPGTGATQTYDLDPNPSQPSRHRRRQPPQERHLQQTAAWQCDLWCRR